MAQLVLKAITLLEKNSILIDGIICDGATTNKKMWKELGVDGTQDKLKHYFSIHWTKIERFMHFQILYMFLNVCVIVFTTIHL